MSSVDLDSLALEEEPTPLAIEPDDMGVNAETMPTVAATQPVIEVQLEPAVLPLMQILPADFPLPLLARFVPSPEIKAELDKAVEHALSLEVKEQGVEGLQTADAALDALNAVIKSATAHFAEPAAIADRLHKSITGVRAEWCSPAEAAKKTLGSRMYTEKARLDKIAADKRRADQEEANRKAREEAAAQVAAAKKNQAPPQVVKQLEQRVETAVAPPVATPVAAPAMKSSTTVTTWKARIKGTPADADPNPGMEALDDVQFQQVRQLLRDIADGTAPRAAISINWSYLNSRAKSDKSTLTITGIEAFAEGSVRAKGSRGR